MNKIGESQLPWISPLFVFHVNPSPINIFDLDNIILIISNISPGTLASFKINNNLFLLTLSDALFRSMKISALVIFNFLLIFACIENFNKSWILVVVLLFDVNPLWLCDIYPCVYAISSILPIMLSSNALVIERSIAIDLVFCISGVLFSSLLISISLLCIQNFGMCLFVTQFVNIRWSVSIFNLSVSLFSSLAIMNSPGTSSIPVALFFASFYKAPLVSISYFILSENH